jgi:dipeptidyl aminopeptidase/acylaminoacyl peptidase
MRISATIALLVVLGPVRAGRAEGPVSAWTPELAFKVKRVGPVRVSPDGSRTAFVVATAVMEGEKSEWVSQIHLAKSDGSGSLQLTAGEKSATARARRQMEGLARRWRLSCQFQGGAVRAAEDLDKPLHERLRLSASVEPRRSAPSGSCGSRS